MNIAIVGWGVEGQSAYRYFGPEHEYLIVSEEPRSDFPAESDKVQVQFIKSVRTPGLTGNVTDLSYLNGIEHCDKIIFSVTNTKNLEKVFGDNASFWSKAVTIQHIFFDEVKTKNIIGITGTKGKGTTASLVYEMLKTAGKTVFLGGNIGMPVLDFVHNVKPDDWVVLELSNFQLYKLDRSPRIAVCLMVVPEHLDWHSDMADYTNAKANLFRYQKPDDIAIYFAGNEYSEKIASNSPGKLMPYFALPGACVREDGEIVIGGIEIIDKSEVKLIGEHNLQNVCAAITTAWQVTQDVDAVRKVLTTFGGLEHRLEFVRETEGVRFYNDSFAATPDAAMAAMEAIPGPKVMIMGGFDRQLPLEHLGQAVAQHAQDIRKIVLIGASAERVADVLTEAGFTNYVVLAEKNMAAIVNQARSFARAGDAVVLSPGFASFDMFKNFEDRGNQYKQAVQAL